MIKNKFASIFGKGLLTILPVYLTVYFIYWLMTGIEKNLGQLLKTILGTGYFPGLGVLLTMVIICVTGVLMQVYVAQYSIQMLEKLVRKIPLVGDLYSSVQSLTQYLYSKKTKESTVVMVDMNGVEVLGITTRCEFSKAPRGVVEKDDIISVYIPMSYQLGGFTIYVPKNKTRKVDMSQKSALKWALIGGIEA